MLSFFPRGVLDEILNLIESVSKDFSSYSSNNKKLFSYIKNMKYDSSGVAPLKKDDINYSELTDQVAILNEQFVSAFTKEDNTLMPSMGPSVQLILRHPSINR